MGRITQRNNSHFNRLKSAGGEEIHFPFCILQLPGFQQFVRYWQDVLCVLWPQTGFLCCSFSRMMTTEILKATVDCSLVVMWPGWGQDYFSNLVCSGSSTVHCHENKRDWSSRGGSLCACHCVWERMYVLVCQYRSGSACFPSLIHWSSCRWGGAT